MHTDLGKVMEATEQVKLHLKHIKKMERTSKRARNKTIEGNYI